MFSGHYTTPESCPKLGAGSSSGVELFQPVGVSLSVHPQIRTLSVHQRRGSVVVSTSAWHAAGRRFNSRTRHVSLLGVKTWLSIEIVDL